jgi:hypothetical protein
VTPAQEALRQAVGDLRSIKARWAVIGGMAVSVRAEPRFTKDVDFALAVASQEEADSVVFHLGSHGYEHQVTLAETATGQVSTVRLRHYRSTVLVDLLMGSCGIEPEIVASARRRDPVALRARLITAMRKIRRNETWLNRDERLLLVSLSSYAGHILLLTDEMEMLDVRQHGGVQLATGFIMPAASTSVYRVVDGYALTRGEDGTLIPADGPLSRRDMWRQARKTGKFIRKGMLDAAPEEIVTVIRQLEDAELLSSKDRD